MYGHRDLCLLRHAPPPAAMPYKMAQFIPARPEKRGSDSTSWGVSNPTSASLMVLETTAILTPHLFVSVDAVTDHEDIYFSNCGVFPSGDPLAINFNPFVRAESWDLYFVVDPRWIWVRTVFMLDWIH